MVPIFLELRPYLEDAFDASPDGAVFVIQRYRHKDTNLWTQFQRIIRRAGVSPWPKLFQNLRPTLANRGPYWRATQAPPRGVEPLLPD